MNAQILEINMYDTDSRPNSVILHKLVYPQTDGGNFKLETVKQYFHEE